MTSTLSGNRKKNENRAVKIENIVASGTIADSVDLDLIAGSLKNCKHNKEKFPGAVYHMEQPKAAALIFASGRVVITGNRNPEDVEVSLHTILEDFKAAGIACKNTPRVTITNIVCSYNLGVPLNLTRIMISLLDKESIEYEPEVFPGLVFRIADPKVVFLLFASGKIIITGGKNQEDIERGLAVMKEKLGIVFNTE